VPRHCHSEWISAQPRACMTFGESQLLTLAILISLVCIQNAVKLVNFFA
jgi:hypothetical protein